MEKADQEDFIWDVLMYIKDVYGYDAKLITWTNYEQEAQILIEIPIFSDQDIIGTAYIKMLAVEVYKIRAYHGRNVAFDCLDRTIDKFVKKFGGLI